MNHVSFPSLQSQVESQEDSKKEHLEGKKDWQGEASENLEVKQEVQDSLEGSRKEEQPEDSKKEVSVEVQVVCLENEEDADKERKKGSDSQAKPLKLRKCS